MAIDVRLAFNRLLVTFVMFANFEARLELSHFECFTKVLIGLYPSIQKGSPLIFAQLWIRMAIGQHVVDASFWCAICGGICSSLCIVLGLWRGTIRYCRFFLLMFSGDWDFLFYRSILIIVNWFSFTSELLVFHCNLGYVIKPEVSVTISKLILVPSLNAFIGVIRRRQYCVKSARLKVVFSMECILIGCCMLIAWYGL